MILMIKHTELTICGDALTETFLLIICGLLSTIHKDSGNTVQVKINLFMCQKSSNLGLPLAIQGNSVRQVKTSEINSYILSVYIHNFIATIW